MGQEDPANRLFMQRLLQQITQKYSWLTPIIRIHFQTTERATPPPFTPAPRNLPDTPVPESNIMSPGIVGKIFAASSGSTPLFDDDGTHPVHQKVISLERQSLGRYSITSRLGDSAISNTYKTYDRLREHDIALKAFQTNALPYYIMKKPFEEEKFFEWETDLLGRLQHPHISPVWNTGKSYVRGTPFIYKTIPYYAEGPLAQWLQRNSGNSKMYAPREVGHVFLQLADALQYLHDHQITFQNFKLTNILVRNTGKELRQLDLVLTDFAIPQDGSFFSRTPDAYPYMAPERWYGQASPASDQYALAVIVYELLTGRHPLQGTTERTMKLLHTNMAPQPPSAFNPYLPPAVNNVLLRALAKRPEERFASVALFARAYQQFCM
jgi:serine/threonine protein kinase